MSVRQTDTDFTQMQNLLEEVNEMLSANAMQRLPTPAPADERIADEQ